MAQIAKLTAQTIPISASHAVAHGLVRAPSIVALLHGCGADITVAGTTITSTNIFITNAGGGPQNAEILVMAPHSIIA